MTAGDPRSVDLRARVRDERALLAESHARVSPGISKAIEAGVQFHSDDAEGFLRPNRCGTHRETSNECAEWLGHAGNVLRRAVEHREQIERF